MEIQKKKKNIDKEKESLTNQKNVISKDEFNKKLLQLENDVKESNLSIQKKQNEITNYRNKAKAEFSKKLISILEEYSKKNSIDIIFRKENLLIGRNSLDVTAGILDLFNKNVKKISVQ